MKKLIFILLFVPCLAQAEPIETSGLFGINNTLWSIDGSTKYNLGFSNQNIYLIRIADGAMSAPANPTIRTLFLISWFDCGDSTASLDGWAIPILGTGMIDMCAYQNCAYAGITKIQGFWMP